MSKQTAINTWKDGLNKDLNPVITPNTVLTDNLNGTFITYNGNEFSLQNDMGNIESSALSPGFYPIGLVEYGGIIYITSVAKTKLIYAKVSYNKDVALSEVINEIQELTKLSSADALSLLTSPGLIVSLSEYQDLESELKDASYITKVSKEETDDTKFEIGTFPSISPANLYIEDVNQSGMDYTYLDYIASIDDDEENDPDVSNKPLKPQPLEYKYRPLYNLIRNNELCEFSTNFIHGYNTSHPITMEIQPSYDGSVNIILTDGNNVPRIINSGFAVLNDGTGVFVKRNQGIKTNYYAERVVDRQTRLINNSINFTTAELGTIHEDGEGEDVEGDERTFYNYIDGVQSGGQLKGGNYTFYFKFGDEDGNLTDIVCESGIVSIFKGTPSQPKTISGAFANEVTDKMVTLTLNDVDTSYSRIYVYYTREYCDLNGSRQTETKALVNPYKITETSKVITISGVEETTDISVEELNIGYYSISSAKTIAQQQNMLFLGNISSENPDNAILQNISYGINVKVDKKDNIGNVSTSYETGAGAEYYDPQNVYYRLGYWPDELYRFGVVYIKADGSNTQVFNLKGCELKDLNDTNHSGDHELDWQNIEDDIFIKGSKYYDNIAGIFKTPSDQEVDILTDNTPLCFTFSIPDNIGLQLQSLGVIGYFIVRQKRIPLTICQGFGVGIAKTMFTPTISTKNDTYYAESFIYDHNDHDNDKYLVYDPIKVENGTIEVAGLKKYLYIEHGTYKNSIFGHKHDHYRAYIIAPNPNLTNKADNTIPWGKILSNTSETDFIYHVTGWHNKKSAAKESGLNWGDQHSVLDAYDWNEPVVLNKTNFNKTYRSGGQDNDWYKDRNLDKDDVQKNSFGLLSVDAIVNQQLQSQLNGSEYTIKSFYNRTNTNRLGTLFEIPEYMLSEDVVNHTCKTIYIPEDTPLKYINNIGFSTRLGDGVNSKDFGYINRDSVQDTPNYKNVFRGRFTPFIGCISDNYTDFIGKLCNITKPYTSIKQEMIVRANNNEPFYAVSNKTVIVNNIDVYRGDCFINTVTLRMHRNFIDSDAPIANVIVKPDAWKKNFKGIRNTDWSQISIGDLNTVSLGHWITFKCLSNTNLGLRSEDTSNTSEMALLGNPRGFYPLYGASQETGMKIADSALLNSGYDATVGRKRYTLRQNVPFEKNDFTNRIIFSNVSVTDSFQNGYRIFQGLSLQDYTKQYGEIVKLVPHGNNLFCAFEHGLAIIPVNEKALMQTTTEQTIHIYGAGVLSEQLSIISQDFGTFWPDSVIKTPIGIYGVDTSAKKIWRFSDSKGLETISDMKIQRFLNDNINTGLSKQVVLGHTNVKTHFNNYKGDVMFTFYNGDKMWNLCYNERQNMWITRFSWNPLMSANIDNSFYSIENVLDLNHPMKIWKHGRTGIDTQFRPTLWYGKQHPFEFEFIVNDPAGVHKIFENLIIVSNNVQPTDIELQIVGDAYLFNKARLYHDFKNIYGNYNDKDLPYITNAPGYTKDNFVTDDFKKLFYNARIEYDPVLDEYSIIINQPCKNKESYGVRLGNIQYKEDGWYTNIEPLRYNVKLNDSSATDFSENDKFASAKIRDKWVKIRIKYKGDQLAVINSIMTVENLSYA